MTVEKFWRIVDKVHRDSKGSMSAKRMLLRKVLRKLPPKEVRSFDAHFGDCEARSYTWELWAAAYIIAGWCSDDSSLISALLLFRWAETSLDASQNLHRL